MKAQSPPSKIARLADSGMGSMGGEDSPETGLGLELGPRPSHGKSGFTFLQLEELENQVLIFKYIVAGVPVPFHLVFPIWKSVSSSFGGGNGGIYQHYPSFLGCSPASFDYRNSMEPEPGRCRRTDGKKWRCSKDVVPDQKYCERHMHRGRQRSRKHVEASQITTATSSSINNTKNSAVNSNTSLSGSIPVSLELMTNINNNRISNTNINTTNNNNSIVSPRLGFSPKSVLQVLGCRNLCFDFIDSMEPEASRCRRTDGRKWQCNRDVVPDQKYCERHVHRGRQSSRKHVETSQLATNTTTTIAKNTNNNLLNSNTNFSIYQ